MIFGSFIDELCDRIKLDKKVLEYRTLAARKINKSYKEICNNSSINWQHLIRTGEIRTIENYITGTCNITVDSRTVTFGGAASITTAMEGRYFQPQDSKNWYRIRRRVSATECPLYSAIKEDTASSRTFTIWNRFYYFPSEVRKILEFGSWINDGIIRERSLHHIRELNSEISNTGEPEQFLMLGKNQFESSYTTGSVSLTEDDDLVTGSGTSWLDNVEEGDLFIVGKDRYHVKRVESDTRIRLINFAKSTVPSGTEYEIKKQDNLGFQLFLNPNDTYIFPYTYIKRVYDMVNEDEDSTEVPEEFDPAILDLAEADRLSDLDDSKWINKQALARARINDLKGMMTSVPRYKQFRPEINSRGAYI